MAPKPFGQLLKEEAVVSEHKIEEAYQRQVLFGGRLGTNLLEINAIDELTLLTYLARSSDLPWADRELLSQPDWSLAERVDQALAETLKAIPSHESEHSVYVVVTDRLDAKDEATLREKVGAPIKQYITSEFRFAELMERAYGQATSPRFSALVERFPLAKSPSAKPAGVSTSSALENLDDFDDGWDDLDLDAPEETEEPQESAHGTEIIPEASLEGDDQELHQIIAKTLLQGEQSPALKPKDKASPFGGNTLMAFGKPAISPVKEPTAKPEETPPAREESSPSREAKPHKAEKLKAPPAAAVLVSKKRRKRRKKAQGPQPLPAFIQNLEKIDAAHELVESFALFAASYGRRCSLLEYDDDTLKGMIVAGRRGVIKIPRVKVRLRPGSDLSSVCRGRRYYQGSAHSGEISAFYTQVGIALPEEALVVPISVSQHLEVIALIDNGDKPLVYSPDLIIRGALELSKQLERAHSLNVDSEDEQHLPSVEIAPLDAADEEQRLPSVEIEEISQAEAEEAVLSSVEFEDFDSNDSTEGLNMGAEQAHEEDSTQASPGSTRKERRFPTLQVIALEEIQEELNQESSTAKNAFLSREHTINEAVDLVSLSEDEEQDDQEEGLPELVGSDLIVDPLEEEETLDIIDVEIVPEEPEFDFDKLSNSDLEFWLSNLDARDEEMAAQAREILCSSSEKVRSFLFSHFPGRILIDRYTLGRVLPPASEHSHLLGCLVEMQGIEDLLVTRLRSNSADERFYALLVLFERRISDDTLSEIAKRIFDKDRQIRELSTRIIKKLSRHSIYEQLIARLTTALYQDDERHTELALAALGELREFAAIRPVIDKLSSPSQRIRDAAKHAATLITLNDLGLDTKKWKKWLRHCPETRAGRIAEAMIHKDRQIRAYAAEELSEFPGVMVNFHPDAHRRERVRARQAFLDWVDSHPERANWSAFSTASKVGR